MNKKRTDRIARCILIGLLFQLCPLKEVKCEPTTVSTTAVLTAYLPVIASYVSGIMSVYVAKTQHWSRGMHSIAQEMERRCPSVATHIQNKQVATPSPATSKGTSSMPAQQSEQQVAAQADITTVSQQDVQRFRAGLRNASAALSASLGQRMHDHLSNMSKPSNFELRNVPGGIRITHQSSGLSFQAALDPPVDRSIQHVLDVDAIIAQLPQEYADALRVCKYIDEGNIEAAAEIARLSTSEAVKNQYEKGIDYLFSYWSQDPLVKQLPARTKLELMGSSRYLAEFFDCVLVRDRINTALCDAWNIKCNAHRVVKDAVYALCDTTKEGKLYCMPELINQRIDEIISKASGKDRDALVEAFYLPNGVLKDFADHTVVKALKMPKAILGDAHVKDRKVINDLVVAHITAKSQAEQLVIMRALANVKYANSYPVPTKMKGVFLESARLVCKSLDDQAQDLVNEFMVDAEHYKHLNKPIQVIAQTEISDAKNILLDEGLTCISRRQFNRALCHEYQLVGMEHAAALIQKDLSEHALQLCYKIITADPNLFAKELPKFTTVVKEGQNQWVERDMQGDVVRVCNKRLKDPITRKAKRYAKEAIKEFGKLPEIAALKEVMQQDLGQEMTVQLPSDDTPKVCGHPMPEQEVHTPGCGNPPEQPDIKVPGCGPLPEDKQPHVNTPGFGEDELKIKSEPCIQPVLDENQKAKIFCAESNEGSKNDISVFANSKDNKHQEADVEWTNHGFKHFPPKNKSWKSVVESTKNGPAKYIPGIDIESIEREAWRDGVPVSNGKPWKVKEYDFTIGAKEGVETKYIRVEKSANTIHGHPITPGEYKKLKG